MKRNRLIVIVVVAVICTALIVYLVTVDRAVQNDSLSIPDIFGQTESIAQGKTLAEQYCGTCHLIPDPSMLNKRNWPLVLDQMKPAYGIFQPDGDLYHIHHHPEQGFYAPNPVITREELYQIIDYYVLSAPAALQQEVRTIEEIKELTTFQIHTAPEELYRNGNTATFIKIDTTSTPARIFVHQSETGTLYLLDQELSVQNSLGFDGVVVDMDIQSDEITVSIIGPHLRGTDEQLGSLFRILISEDGKMSKSDQPIMTELARPIHVESLNLNNTPGYLISEFGLLSGGLFWMERKTDGQYKRNPIRPVTGSINGYVQEKSNDSTVIWALFAQGNEGIFKFTYDGDRVIQQKQVLQFPPTYGSTSFELVDFNNDGYPDILYTAGDRGDGIPQYKPYHGVYIYLNNGNDEFTQEYFFPLNGAYKAVARDFSGNGELDIAAIGYFLHDRKPEERFVFLENQGEFNFQPYFLPQKLKFERVITMDAADVNGNGKPDIILGNGFVANETDETEPLFIVLENNF